MLLFLFSLTELVLNNIIFMKINNQILFNKNEMSTYHNRINNLKLGP